MRTKDLWTPGPVQRGSNGHCVQMLAPALHPTGRRGLLLQPDGLAVPTPRKLLRNEVGAITASGLFTPPWVNSLSNTAPIFNLGVANTNLYCALFLNTITPNFDDTLANCAYGAGVYASGEASGTNYTAGGDPLANNGVGNEGGGLLEFSANNVQWTVSTITSAAGALLYDHSMTPKYAFALVNFGGTYSTSGGTFTIQWALGGIFTWQTR